MRAIVFEENGWWVGQCIERDIAAQSETLEGLKKELKDQIGSYKELAQWEGAKEPSATPQDVVDKLRQRAGVQEIDLGE